MEPSRVFVGRVTVTEHVLLAGAAWLLPSPTLTVIVADPAAFPVTVMILSDTLTEATLGALETAEMAPFPARVAVIVPDSAAALKVIEVLFRVKLPAALLIVQLTVFAVVLPSGHL